MQVSTNKNAVGIDISHWTSEVKDAQGNIIVGVNGIDFNVVKNQGVQFIYAKALGDYTIDDYFLTNAIGARSAGIPIGGYHYIHVSDRLEEPEKLAEAFINVLEATFGVGRYGDLIPVIDIEEPVSDESILSHETVGDKLNAADILTFVVRYKNYFEQRTGIQLMIYTAEWWVKGEPTVPFRGFQDFYGTNNPIKSMPLWTAAWTRYGYQFPRDYGGWTKWTVWQHSDQGNILGISDRGTRYNSPVGSINLNVDLNYAESLCDILIKYPRVQASIAVPIITGVFGFVTALIFTKLFSK